MDEGITEVVTKLSVIAIIALPISLGAGAQFGAPYGFMAFGLTMFLLRIF